MGGILVSNIASSPQDYVSNGILRGRVESLIIGDNAAQFEQRINYHLLNQTYLELSAIYIGRGGSSEIYCFLPSTSDWRARADAPFIFVVGSSMTFDQANGLIYASNTTHLFSYDVANDLWSYVDTLPAQGGAGSNIIFLNDSLYYIVGGGSQLFYEYDPVAGVWTALSNVPEPVDGYAVSTSGDGRIYLVVDGSSDGFYAYDPITDSWSLLEYTPSSRATGLTFYQGKVYMADVGGGVFRYDTTNNLWESLNPKVPIATFDYGNRLLIDGQYIYFVRMDGTREVYYITLSVYR